MRSSPGPRSTRAQTRWLQAVATAAPGAATATVVANPQLRLPPPPRPPYGRRARSPLGVARYLPQRSGRPGGRLAPCPRVLYAATPPILQRMRGRPAPLQMVSYGFPCEQTVSLSPSPSGRGWLLPPQVSFGFPISNGKYRLLCPSGRGPPANQRRVRAGPEAVTRVTGNALIPPAHHMVLRKTPCEAMGSQGRLRAEPLAGQRPHPASSPCGVQRTPAIQRWVRAGQRLAGQSSLSLLDWS